MLTLIMIIIAYLIGSVSSSIIVAKILGAPDPRTQGSHSAGATNTLRTAGTKAAVFVLLGDTFKGFFVMYLAHTMNLDNFSLALIGLAAIVGHIFPLYFKFKGGKGVATMLGVALGTSLMLGLFLIAVWIVVAAVTRYSSLSSLTATACLPVLCFFTGHSTMFIPFLIIAILIFYKHSANIQRLRSGIESKIHFKKS